MCDTVYYCVSKKFLGIYNNLFLWCSGTIEIYPTLRYRTETVTPAAVNGLGNRIF
jgi:hypothetical protein